MRLSHKLERERGSLQSTNTYARHLREYDHSLLRLFVSFHPHPQAERTLSRFYVRDVEEGEFLCGDRFTYDKVRPSRTAVCTIVR